MFLMYFFFHLYWEGARYFIQLYCVLPTAAVLSESLSQDLVLPFGPLLKPHPGRSPCLLLSPSHHESPSRLLSALHHLHCLYLIQPLSLCPTSLLRLPVFCLPLLFNPRSLLQSTWCIIMPSLASNISSLALGIRNGLAYCIPCFKAWLSISLASDSHLLHPHILSSRHTGT